MLLKVSPLINCLLSSKPSSSVLVHHLLMIVVLPSTTGPLSKRESSIRLLWLVSVKLLSFQALLLLLLLPLHFLLHFHEPLELEPLSDLFLLPSFFFFSPVLFSFPSFKLGSLLILLSPVSQVILTLLVPHSFPLFSLFQCLFRVFLPPFLVFTRVILQISLYNLLLLLYFFTLFLSLSLPLFVPVELPLEPIFNLLFVLGLSILLKVFNPSLPSLFPLVLLILLEWILVYAGWCSLDLSTTREDTKYTMVTGDVLVL